jgi:DUF1009 family protein
VSGGTPFVLNKSAGFFMVAVEDLISPVGLIAGNGTFPVEVARRAKERGLTVVAVAHRGETDPALESVVSKVRWVRVGQLGKLISFLRSHDVRHVAFAGGISRVKLFGGVSLDWRGAALVARLRSIKDDVILRGIAGELEREGLQVFGASLLLDRALPAVGPLTQRLLTVEERRDAVLGWEAAKVIGGLDIGQTVVAGGGLVVAVEAVEGTDKAIERAHQLAGRGLVVVKVCKPHQDERLDLPTIGRQTIATCERNGVTALVVEAGKTIILEPDEVVREANRLGIAIQAVSAVAELASR